MKSNQTWLVVIAATLVAPAAFAADGDTNSAQAAEIEALKKEVQVLEQKVDSLEKQAAPEQSSPQVQALDQKIRILEREREIDKDDAAALAKAQPKISIGANGFSFGSADSNFVATLHGLVQADSRTFFGDRGLINGNDSFLLRRARPIFSGTVFHDFDFNFTPDFGGNVGTVQILDAYLNYRYSPSWQLEAGKFKSPVGLEQLQSDPVTTFNERSIANNLVPNRDLGVELHGDLFGGILSYAAGIFDGAPDYIGTTVNADSDDDKAFAGRLFIQPFKTTTFAPLQGFGFGVGGSYEDDRGGTAAGTQTGLTTGYKTDGQQTFFSYNSTVVAAGTHWRVSPQAYYYYGPFGLLGEYVVSDQSLSGGSVTGKAPVDLQNTAWEISGGWVLTGENASYSGVTPRNPFNLHTGQWGAWQAVARYGELDVDDNAFKDGFATTGSASEAQAWSVGLNWFLNKDIRINASYSRTTFTDYNNASTTVTRYPENVLFTRIQLSF
jgi:phosphate-selective porin OprO/OprP